MATWHVEVLTEDEHDRLTDDQIGTLAASLPGYPVMHHNTTTGELTLRFQVEASSTAEAADLAFDAAYGALQSALQRVLLAAPPISLVRVLTGEDLAAEPGSTADRLIQGGREAG